MNHMTPEQSDALELKYMALAQKEVVAREETGLDVTEEWLDELERKYQALALQEVKRYERK